MLKLYTWTTPNGFKVPILLEELGLEYEICPININKGEQKTPAFLAMNPNHKIPVLVDDSITLAESGAILVYLADKHGKFLPKDGSDRYVALQWLFFQVGSVGPMFGQANHFLKHAPEQIPYGIKRYTKEANRLMAVMNTRLADADYLGGDYSIADVANWPWVNKGISNGYVVLDEYTNVARWYKAIESRSAVTAAYGKTKKICKGPAVCEPTFN